MTTIRPSYNTSTPAPATSAAPTTSYAVTGTIPVQTSSTRTYSAISATSGAASSGITCSGNTYTNTSNTTKSLVFQTPSGVQSISLSPGQSWTKPAGWSRVSGAIEGEYNHNSNYSDDKSGYYSNGNLTDKDGNEIQPELVEVKDDESGIPDIPLKPKSSTPTPSSPTSTTPAETPGHVPTVTQPATTPVSTASNNPNATPTPTM